MLDTEGDCHGSALSIYVFWFKNHHGTWNLEWFPEVNINYTINDIYRGIEC